ncbi:MAG: PilZ domain-containing protein [Pseudomonadales bacterium]|nr:PilZ domain-containing protein [Pseudomonadales bacterium]
MAFKKEQRQYVRYSGEALSINIDTKCATRNQISCIDFNRHGMALASNQPMAVGEQLSLMIKQNEVMSIQVEAAVCYRLKRENTFVFGVKFYFQTDNIQTQQLLLEAIETILALTTP